MFLVSPTFMTSDFVVLSLGVLHPNTVEVNNASALSAHPRYRITNTTDYAGPLRLPHICLPIWLCIQMSSNYAN